MIPRFWDGEGIYSLRPNKKDSFFLCIDLPELSRLFQLIMPYILLMFCVDPNDLIFSFLTVILLSLVNSFWYFQAKQEQISSMSG
jgi:hypothetical protein